MFKKLSSFITLHKFLSFVIAAVLVGGGYFGYQSLYGAKTTTRYVTAVAEKGTLIVSVSGSGQVSVSDQVDIKSEVSGDVIYVGAANGQEVKAGTLLVQVDSTDAQKSVRDAEANLESAKLSLEKLVGPEGQAVPTNKQTAQYDLQKAYDDGYSDVSNAFLNLPSIMTNLQNILYTNDTTLGGKIGQSNIEFYAEAVKDYDVKSLTYRDDTNVKYLDARNKYNQNFQDYKNTSRSSDTQTIENMINESYDTAKAISEAVKSANNLIQFYKDKLAEVNRTPATIADTHLATFNSDTGKINSIILTLSGDQNTIKNDKDAISNADLDIKSQNLSLQQKQNALLDIQEKLADYYIRAPFGGVIAAMDIKKGDSVSSGTAIATIITKQRIAEITLNEIDVAKVKTGQKANITFDAVPDLNITGEVTEIDTLGIVTQGVVNYGVKVGFDTQDERVKPGMSASVAIITEAKQNVILIPNSAVKSNGISYVELLNDSVPQQQTIEIGLSNDTMTEVVSGLKEGDKVVTQTITGNTTNITTSSQNRGFRLPGM